MKRNIFLAVALVAIFTFGSCRLFTRLTSATTISPNNSFVLGNNEHGTFSVQLKNTSNKTINTVLIPISGGSHSSQIVNSGETINVKVDANTTLIIKNPNDKTVNVYLKIKGDTGLSMGYNKL